MGSEDNGVSAWILLGLAVLPQVQNEAEDDWTLPEWAQLSPFSGYYSCSVGPLNDNAEVQLAWKDFEPQDNVFDWSPLENALKTGKHGIWVRFYASDARHVPEWLKAKYADLKPLRFRWPDQPYVDIYKWTGQKSPGDFYPMWDPRLEKEWREAMKDFGRRGFARHPRFFFAYYPHGWCWGEYSLKWVPEMAKAGFTPEQYVEWFKRMTQDYIEAMAGQAGKLVYTGTGKEEWVENPGDAKALARWRSVINPPGGGNALSQAALGRGTGVRDGFTEVFNGYADRPDWGTKLTPLGEFRYSIVDDDNPLVASTDRFFGTENEDFQYNWPNVNEYFYVKMAVLNTLRLRMNWMIPGNPKLGAALYEYARKTLGKHAGDTPDAWAALRQYRLNRDESWTAKGQDTDENIRHFERWLYQREVPEGGRTLPACRINYPREFAGSNGEGAFEAIRTDRTTGNNYICFGVDDRFLNGGKTPVQVKLTYLDNFAGKWGIEYDAADGNAHKKAKPVENRNDGTWKTVTFEIPDAAFQNRQKGGMDFRIHNGGSNDLTVRFVRVIRLTPPPPRPTKGKIR
jgi:hypothetical protein